MGCLAGCLRFVVLSAWRLLAAAAVAVLLARIDEYVEQRHRESVAGRAWRTYRGRRGGVRRGAPADAGGAIDTEGRPR